MTDLVKRLGEVIERRFDTLTDVSCIATEVTKMVIEDIRAWNRELPVEDAAADQVFEDYLDAYCKDKIVADGS